MSAFWDKSKQSAAKKPEEKKVAKVSAVSSSTKKRAAAKKMDAAKASLFSRTVMRPVISENAMNQQMLGKYVFKVAVCANKSEIADSIKAIYGVDVEKVNVVRYKAESKMFRSKQGQKKQFKKAIVTVVKGQTIEMFKEK